MADPDTRRVRCPRCQGSFSYIVAVGPPSSCPHCDYSPSDPQVVEAAEGPPPRPAPRLDEADAGKAGRQGGDGPDVDDPASATGAPRSDDEPAGTGDEPAAPADGSARTDDEPPPGGDEASETDDETPETDDEPPPAGDEAPETDDETPTTHDDPPGADADVTTGQAEVDPAANVEGPQDEAGTWAPGKAPVRPGKADDDRPPGDRRGPDAGPDLRRHSLLLALGAAAVVVIAAAVALWAGTPAPGPDLGGHPVQIRNACEAPVAFHVHVQDRAVFDGVALEPGASADRPRGSGAPTGADVFVRAWTTSPATQCQDLDGFTGGLTLTGSRLQVVAGGDGSVRVRAL